MKELTLESTLPFSEEDDFNRSVIAKRLISLIEVNQNPLTICVDGPWGEGKTSFTFKAIKEFKQKDYLTIYFNAFSVDFQEDPLIALLGSVVDASDYKKEKRNDLIRSLSKSAKPLIKTGANIFIKTISSNLVSLADFQESTKEEFLNSLDETVNNHVAQAIDNYTKKDASIQALRTKLQEVADESDKKGVVFFIDELDRCRPDFALAVIEKIKHVLNHGNIHFFLVMNKEQLQGTLHHAYGYSEGVNNYLEKFLDYTIRLPAHKVGDAKSKFSNTSSYVFIECKKRLPPIIDDHKTISIMLAFLCDLKGFNLRKAEHVLNRVIVIRMMLDNDIREGGFVTNYINNYRIETSDYFIPLCVVLDELNLLPDEVQLEKNADSLYKSDKGMNFAFGLFKRDNDGTGAIHVDDFIKKSPYGDCIRTLMILLYQAGQDVRENGRELTYSGSVGGSVRSNTFEFFRNIAVLVSMSK